MDNETTLETLSLDALFKKEGLAIPDYQRDYSWRDNHVLDLLHDTFARLVPGTNEQQSPMYLLGTVILHDNNGTLDIVDGQQRLVTLTIILHCLKTTNNGTDNDLPLLKANFSANAARFIRRTRDVVNGFLAGKSEKKKFAENIRNCLRFHVLTLSKDNALDRAYVFFDSVNSKGKPLSDFDLLKAHHLMYIPPQQETLATEHNNVWQDMDEQHPHLFGTLLRRLRMWGRRQDRDSRNERPDYNEFCSVTEPELEWDGEHHLNRYLQPAAFRSWRRAGGQIVLSMDYPAPDGEALVPTEITQTIEGGDAFFLYAKRYHKLHAALFTETKEPLSPEIIFLRKLKEHIWNDYLRGAFQATMLLYYDKFGDSRLISAATYVEQIISARRWETGRLRIEGVLTHVKDKNIIPILLESINARHACAQLRETVLRLSPVKHETNTQDQYFEVLNRFYNDQRDMIRDEVTKKIIKSRMEINKER